MARRLILILGIVGVLAVLAYPEPNVQDTIESAFVPGGTIHLRLSYGDFTIKSGLDDRIIVHWVHSHGVDIHDKMTMDVTGNTAQIRTDGQIKHGHFVVELPAHSDIVVRMKAGDLQISRIEGNKDIHVTAGDLTIETNPASYSRVQGSVTIGDLDAPSLHVSKSGFHRSFERHGDGTYQLRASVTIGDLKIP